MLHKGMVHYPAADDTGATRALYPGALSTRHSLLGVNTKMLVPLSYHPSISSYSSSSSPMFCAAVALSLCSAGVIQIRRGSYKQDVGGRARGRGRGGEGGRYDG